MSPLLCATCRQTIGQCTCTDADARMRQLARDPSCPIILKWCRACDKHYARCRCTMPDFCIVGGGRTFQPEELKTLSGEPAPIDLSPNSERGEWPS